MQQFKDLLQIILDKGYTKCDRTGVGTKSMFGYQCRFDLQDGFPIVTLKRTAFKAAVTELIWMIGGWRKQERYKGYSRTNIKFLIDNGVKIWTEWPYKAYCQAFDKRSLENGMFNSSWYDKETFKAFTQQQFEEQIKTNDEFAMKFGELGPVYQKQWREFEGKKDSVDQLVTMINRLKTNPDCRRNLTSYWNPTELSEMLLPPCHLLHQVWTRELTFEEKIQWVMKNTDVEMENLYITEEACKESTPKRAISLQMYQRSSDCFLGVPFDWVFYALLTHILAEQTNMTVGEFIWTSGDTHLYTNQIEPAKEVLSREPHPLPSLKINRKVDDVEDYVIGDFELINYKYNDAIKVAVAV